MQRLEGKKEHWFSTFGGVEVGMGWVRKGEEEQEMKLQRQTGSEHDGLMALGALWGNEEEGGVRDARGSPWCGGGLGWGRLRAGRPSVAVAVLEKGENGGPPGGGGGGRGNGGKRRKGRTWKKMDAGVREWVEQWGLPASA